MMVRSTVMLLALALMGGMAVPEASHGQAQIKSMTWTEESKLDASGLVSQLVRFGGMSPAGPRESHMHVQDGRFLISGDDNTVVMFDFEGDEFQIIDHESRSVMHGKLSTMPELTKEMVENIRVHLDSSPDLSEAMRQTPEQGVSMTFDVNTHRRVRSERIGEYSADVHYVVVETTSDRAPDGAPSAEPTRIWIVNALWESHDAPTEAQLLAELEMSVLSDSNLMGMADMFGESADPMAAFGLLDAWIPGMGQALAEMGQATSEFDGTILRSVIAVSTSPPGQQVAFPEFEAMITSEQGESSGGPSVGGAVRGALGGLLGRRAQAQESPQQASPYTRHMRLTSNRENYRYWTWQGDVVGDLRQKIQGYSVQSFEEMLEEARRSIPTNR